MHQQTFPEGDLRYDMSIYIWLEGCHVSCIVPFLLLIYSHDPHFVKKYFIINETFHAGSLVNCILIFGFCSFLFSMYM